MPSLRRSACLRNPHSSTPTCSRQEQPLGWVCQVIPNETLFQGKVLGEASTACGKTDSCSSEEQGPVLPGDG